MAVALARRRRAPSRRKKETLRAGMRTHYVSGLRAPKAFKNGALRHGSFMLGEVTAPKCHHQAKVFHELNPRKIELLQDVLAFLLHPHLCRLHSRRPEPSPHQQGFSGESANANVRRKPPKWQSGGPETAQQKPSRRLEHAALSLLWALRPGPLSS